MGDEYFPAARTGDDLVELIATMRTAATEAGRDPDGIAIATVSTMDLERVKRLADLGVTRVVVPNLGGDPESWRARLGGFAENVIMKI